MTSSSDSPFWQQLWETPEREAMMVESPALLTMSFQHVMGALQESSGSGHPPITDPLRYSSIVKDQVQVLLSCVDSEDLMLCVFPDHAAGQPPFWRAMRVALEFLWGVPSLVPDESDASVPLLQHVAQKPLFVFPLPSAPRLPLPDVSFCNALHTSEATLRYTMTAGLSASLREIPATHKGLQAVLALARIVPDSGSDTGITAEGLHFCMVPTAQQWWVLLQAALHRIFQLTAAQPELVTRKSLWQRLAVLCLLDSTCFVYAFSSKEEDPAGYHLLVRLAEIGLVYPLKGPQGERCFAVSPHLRHAVDWKAPAPLCSTSLQRAEAEKGKWRNLRQEELDTIVTETNFRLFVYSLNPDLLRVVEAFAVKEEVVNDVLACFRITRSSFGLALQKGLTAAQIMQFLSTKAHPSMTRRYGSPNLRSEVETTVCLPQSFMDQLFMWEKEHHRITFKPHMVLIRNLTPAQLQLLRQLLSDYGESGSLVHEEPGLAVVREDVYQRLLARYME